MWRFKLIFSVSTGTFVTEIRALRGSELECRTEDIFVVAYCCCVSARTWIPARLEPLEPLPPPHSPADAIFQRRCCISRVDALLSLWKMCCRFSEHFRIPPTIFLKPVNRFFQCTYKNTCGSLVNTPEHELTIYFLKIFLTLPVIITKS